LAVRLGGIISRHPVQTVTSDSDSLPGGQDTPPSPEETMALLRRVRAGDDEALDALLSRLLPRLRRIAHGRLPRAARGLLETGDIVQIVAARCVRHLATIDVPHAAALGYYMRQAIANEIAGQWRRAGRAPAVTTAGDSLADDDTSPLDRLIGVERLQRYEAALQRLDEQDREAIVGRFEFGYQGDDLARYLGKPTAGAARVAVHRAVKRLTEQARHV
jgi:RNA polymerase sigma-70 factor (ECF subfamily)